MHFPIPDNEDERLAYLESLNLQSSPPIQEIQDLCDLAAELTRSDIALVSLIGKDEQRFAANHGLTGVSGTPREQAFCSHAIMNSGQFIVEDARTDSRFSSNPLVTGEPNIVAYAGTVLEPEPDLRVGTMCVINRTPRRYSAFELQALERIGRSVSALLSTYRDRVRLKEALDSTADAQRKLQQAAQIDALTELLNYSAFGRICEKRIARHQGHSYLAIIDVDQFKQINDRHGHQFGDRYLKTFAAALWRGLPEDAVLGRLGGDEFGVFYQTDDSSPDHFVLLLETCEQFLLDACRSLGLQKAGRASFGVSMIPHHADTYEQMYQLADVALYASKQSGRSRITLYDKEIDQQFNTISLRRSFEDACENGRIVPYFQPIADIATGETLFFEMLCRWNHPARGLLMPADFFLLFDDHQCAPQITFTLSAQIPGAHLRSHAARQSARICINVTAHDLYHPEFFEEIERALRKSGVAWTNIVIEISENLVLDGTTGELYERVVELKRRGAKIALDDFGTGHSGFKHLKSWPVDIVKIDKSFIRNICKDRQDRAIVESIVRLSKYLGKLTIAEGVETREQLEALREIGCDAAQGYYFGRPAREMATRVTA
jgi:diguanylate cyclase (GGDEF)-like protein